LWTSSSVEHPRVGRERWIVKDLIPLLQAPQQAVAFVECIEALEEFGTDKKTTKVATSKGKRRVMTPADQRNHTAVC